MTAPAGAAGAAGVILAAGLSRRMGSHNKLLLPYRGRPLLDWTVDLAQVAGLAPLLGVTGPLDNGVGALLARRSVTSVANANPASGMAGSVRAGLAALGEDVAAAVVLLGDMPLIQAATVAALCAAVCRHPDALAIVPVHGGRRGNPVLWTRQAFRRLLALEGDVGGRHILESEPGRVVAIPVNDTGILTDVDTPEDYRMLLRASTDDRADWRPVQ